MEGYEFEEVDIFSDTSIQLIISPVVRASAGGGGSARDLLGDLVDYS